MTIISEQILARIAIEQQAVTLRCICEAIQALSTNALPDALNPYYEPPATTGVNPSPSPEQFPVEWTLCGAAYGYMEYIARFCDRLGELAQSPIWSGLALLAAIVGGATLALTPGVNVALALGGASTATALWLWVSNAAEDSLAATFAATANDMRTNVELRKCFAGEFVATGEIAALQQVVDDKSSNALIASLAKLLITQETIDAHTNGVLDGTNLYFPEGNTADGCTCVDAPTITTFNFDEPSLMGWYNVPIITGSVTSAVVATGTARSQPYALKVTIKAQSLTAWEWRYNLGGTVRLNDTFRHYARELSGNTTAYVEVKFTDGTFARSTEYHDWAANTWQPIALTIGANDVGKTYEYVALFGGSGSGYAALGYWFVDDVTFELW